MSLSPNKKSLQEIVPFFFELEGRLRLQHWNTRSQARHKASCQAIVAVVKSMDLIVEALLGRLDRSMLLGFFDKRNQVSQSLLTDSEIVKFLQTAVSQYQEWTSHPVIGQFPDILNLRDDLVGQINTVLYLMTLE